jgi:transcriptional regulator with XRE-family HTH domain
LFKLGSQTGITDKYLQRIEKGKQTNIGLNYLILIADFFGVTIDELVGHEICKEPKCDDWLPDKKGKKK